MKKHVNNKQKSKKINNAYDEDEDNSEDKGVMLNKPRRKMDLCM